MTDLPSGTVTFLFTDIEGSTVLWEQYPEQARTAMSRHDEIVEDVVGRHDGMLVRPRGEGDSRFAVFRRATDAGGRRGSFAGGFLRRAVADACSSARAHCTAHRGSRSA